MNHGWKIGNVEIPNRVVVAPMAGISNSAFRVTVKEAGAGLVVCEMISDQGIHFRHKKTLEMLYIDETEHPLSIQIFGGTKDSLVEAAKFVAENTTADIIDINTGPVIEGEKTIEEMGEEILEYCIRAASGDVTPKSVLLNQDDFIPWKRGVSL